MIVPSTGLSPMSAAGRRVRSVERQLAALRATQSRLDTKDILYAVLSIPLIAALCLLVAAKFYMLSGSLVIAAAVAIGVGIAAWLVGARWFKIPTLIIYALLLLLLESGDFPGIDGDSGKKPSRRDKLERAIARRETLLRKLQARPPA